MAPPNWLHREHILISFPSYSTSLLAFSMAGISRRDSRTSLGPGPAGTQVPGPGPRLQILPFFGYHRPTFQGKKNFVTIYQYLLNEI